MPHLSNAWTQTVESSAVRFAFKRGYRHLLSRIFIGTFKIPSGLHDQTISLDNTLLNEMFTKADDSLIFVDALFTRRYSAY
jgi:hypothetical protein